ncbi:hypothetical protein ILYODFUR_034725 [Ilyodon furcidens]|uniref:Uncharacterized protein n=1 Tax=Ilyodon furcidens TaxID=33524 RepID=A0ABV0VJJ4_9TELE
MHTHTPQECQCVFKRASNHHRNRQKVQTSFFSGSDCFRISWRWATADRTTGGSDERKFMEGWWICSKEDGPGRPSPFTYLLVGERRGSRKGEQTMETEFGRLL